MNAIGAVVVFAVLPLAVVAVVVGFVLGPGWSRAGRWRPGEPWLDESVTLTSDVPGATGDSGDPGDSGEATPAVAVAAQTAPSGSGELVATGSAELEPQVGAQKYGGARGRW